MKDKILAAYYGDGGYHKLQFTKADIMKLTHVNWAFAVVKNGKVVGDHLRNIEHLHHFKQFNPKLKTLLSIGGWGAGGFSEAAATEEGRQLFADTAIALMLKHEFDGLDVDWEYPGIPAAGIAASKNDKYNFTKLLKTMREKLDRLEQKLNRSYLLTIAVGAYQRCADNMEVELIAREYLDFINLMTYDLGSGMNLTHHHTNLYGSHSQPQLLSVEKAVDLYVKAGVPLEKLVIGGAFYARKWSEVPDKNDGLYQQTAAGGLKTIDYTELAKDYIGKRGFKRYWDDEAKAPYLYNGKSFISYDDPESLGEKARYVRERGLLGIMFWEYPLDDTRTLLDSLYRNLFG